jgi:hypothetical protein
MFVGVDFAFDFVAWAAPSVPIRASALNHKVWDNAVEDKAVIKPLLGEVYKIFDRVWSVGIKKLNVHRALVGFNNCASHRYDPQIFIACNYTVDAAVAALLVPEGLPEIWGEITPMAFASTLEKLVL